MPGKFVLGQILPLLLVLAPLAILSLNLEPGRRRKIIAVWVLLTGAVWFGSDWLSAAFLPDTVSRIDIASTRIVDILQPLVTIAVMWGLMHRANRLQEQLDKSGNGVAAG